MEATEEKIEKTEKKELKAKDVSLWAKIAGAVILVVGAILKWAGVFENADIKEIAIVAYGIMGLFGTVDINLLFEKMFHYKKEE